MKPKFKPRILIDISMTVILILLMAFQSTGQKAHEWLGAAMLILFLVHNFINGKWYKNLFKGKYNTLRVIRAALNIALLFAVLGAMISGIAMSHYAFGFLDLKFSAVLSRKIHLCSVYWCFVLVSIHIGLHWSVAANMVKKVKSVVIFLRITAAATAIYGAVCTYKNSIFSYMLLRSEFAFFDFDKGVLWVIVQNLSMMAFWIFITYYGTKKIKENDYGSKGF